LERERDREFDLVRERERKRERERENNRIRERERERELERDPEGSLSMTSNTSFRSDHSSFLDHRERENDVEREREREIDSVSDSMASSGMKFKSTDNNTIIHSQFSNLLVFDYINNHTFIDIHTHMLHCTVLTSYSEYDSVELICRHYLTEEWQRFNQSHISRTYPKASRSDSSNQNPIIPWSAGIQMVAMNYQTHSEDMQLYASFFRQNGGCGYVLKPEYMYNSVMLPKPTIMLQVHIISGQYLPHNLSTKDTANDIISPYVTVGVRGVKEDTTLYKSQLVTSNGFNPVWDEVFEFKVSHPELAHLMFRLYDENGIYTMSEFVAYSSIPVPCIRPGLRTVCLYNERGDRRGDFMFSSLTVRTKIINIS